MKKLINNHLFLSQLYEEIINIIELSGANMLTKNKKIVTMKHFDDLIISFLPYVQNDPDISYNQDIQDVQDIKTVQDIKNVQDNEDVQDDEDVQDIYI